MRWFDGINDALDMNLGNFGRWWGTGKSDMLHFMGSWRVGHYLKTEQTARNLQRYSSLWRRKWQPTPVFLPGEFHGQRSLASYSPWGFKESDTTEQLSLSHGLLFRCKKEWGADTHNIDEPGRHYTKWNKSDTNEQILYDPTYIRYLECVNS